MNDNIKQKTTIVRQEMMAKKVVIVDGQAGCGKTMLSPIVASLDRVELLSYAFEVEFICRLYNLKKIDHDASVAMVRMLTDHKLYQTMMGRDVNFRYSDLSSVFKSPNKWKYFKRIFQRGDDVIPARIRKESPILNLTTHELLSVSQPIMSGMAESVVFIEVIRHPLYMIIQQQLNMENLITSPRDIQVCFSYNGKQLPHFAYGWEDKFLKANPMEKAIYTIDMVAKTTNKMRKIWQDNKKLSIVTIPFEKFVLEPWSYMSEIESKLCTKISKQTYQMLKKQNVPRKVIADSPILNIYKRCGWIPPSEGSEEAELKKRRAIVAENASPEALETMDRLSEEYEKQYFTL